MPYPALVRGEISAAVHILDRRCRAKVGSDELVSAKHSCLVGQALHRWPLERGTMGAGEGGDDFGQCAEMEVDQAADGVVMVEEVVIGGQ